MLAKLHIWWQKIRKPLLIFGTILACVFVIGLLVAIIGGYLFNWSWTGLAPYTPPSKDSNFQRGKTLWDWLQLLIIPLVLAVGGFMLSQMQKNSEQKTTIDDQREAALQSYIDKISELLLEHHLGELKPEYQGVCEIARARTLAVLPRLDKDRKRSILLFLYESNLIRKGEAIINLSEADFSGIDLSGNHLKNINLDHTNFRGANLKGVWFYGASFEKADLTEADLSGGRVVGCRLIETTLIDTNFSETRFLNNSMPGANLRGANLSKADLPGIYLGQVDLAQVNLSGANLKGATGVPIDELEKKAKSLKGATMPDGKIHP